MWRVMIWYCAIVSVSAYSSPVTMTFAPTRLFKGPVNALAFAGMKNGCVVMQYVYILKTNAHLFLQALFSFDSTFLRRCGCHNFLVGVAGVAATTSKVMANYWFCAGGFPAKNVLWPLVLHGNGVRRVRVEACIVRQASGDRASTI